MNESVGTVAEQSLVIKPRAVILPIVSICRIAFFILSMSSVRQKKVNNVFVHHKRECTGWCYSKKKQKQQQSNIRYTVKSTMNVYKDYGFRVFSTALLCWIPEIWKKKQETAKTYTNAQILAITITILIISQYSNIIIADENNDMTPTPNLIAS